MSYLLFKCLEHSEQNCINNFGRPEKFINVYIIKYELIKYSNIDVLIIL